MAIQRRVGLRRNKFNARPTMGTTGRRRHSLSEAAYERFLRLRELAGEVLELRLCNDPPAERYTLAVYRSDLVEELLELFDRCTIGDKYLELLVSRLRSSREVVAHYTPDFSYREPGALPDQRTVVDTKGYETPEFSIKRKLMRACHGIDVQVIRVPRAIVKQFGKE